MGDATFSYSPTTAARRHARLRRWLSFVSIVVAALIALAAVMGETFLVPHTTWRLERRVVLLIAAITAGWSFASRFLPARMALGGTTFLVVLALWTALAQRPPQRGDQSFDVTGQGRVWSSSHDWTKLLLAAHDERYGFRPRHNTVEHDHHRDFDVDYTFDATGWRRMPPSQAPAGERPIVFVGCSYTFGVGVRDDETFAARLQAGPWRNRRVLNRACYGWGTTHALLVTKDACADDPPPRLVCYGYMSGHPMRNYLGKNWHPALSADFPHFELEGDRPVYQGIRPASFATLEASPQLQAQEERLTVALVEELQRECAQAGGAFALLVLERFPEDAVLDELRRRDQVPMVDLWDVSLAYHPHNWHPKPEWHQAIARAIAGHPWFAEAASWPDLLQPDALPPSREMWNLNVVDAMDGDATLRWLEGATPTLRFEAIRSPRENAFDVNLLRGIFQLAAGQACLVRFEMRADAPRTVQFRLDSQAHGGFGVRACRLTDQWQPFAFQHTPSRTEPGLHLMFALGESTTPVEIRQVRVTIDDRVVLSSKDDAG